MGMGLYSKVNCDGCGKQGNRAPGCVSPNEWKFICTHTTPPGHEIFIYACSTACMDKILNMWTTGPGKLKDWLP